MRLKTAARLGAFAALLALTAPASAGYISTTIATGLNNPRGLAFGPDGALYIAESGFIDASGPTTTIRGNTFHLGATGSITRYANGTQTRIVTGLPSLSAPTTNEVTGPQDVAVGADGTGYVVVGLGTDPTVRTTDLAPGGAGLGKVYTFTNAGSTTSLADISAYELANNPAGGPLDSNPFHLAVTGSGLAATDAGGNSFFTVGGDGTVSLVATFPGRDIGGGFPSDAVPTGVALGPDGNYYVGQLTGFPFTPGAAQIYRVTPSGEVTVSYTGFTMITDLAFDGDGNLFVLQLDNDGLAQPGVGGSLIRLGTDGSRQTIFSDGLIMPTGLAIGPDGAFYVTNFSASAGQGQVWRIAETVPEPAALALLGLGVLGIAVRGRGPPPRPAAPRGRTPAPAAGGRPPPRPRGSHSGAGGGGAGGSGGGHRPLYRPRHSGEPAQRRRATISNTVGVIISLFGSRAARSISSRTASASASLRYPSSTSRALPVSTNDTGHCQTKFDGGTASTIGRASTSKPSAASQSGRSSAISGSPPVARQLAITAST